MKKFYAVIILMMILGQLATAQLVLNEVLYDPPSGIEGDANKDGVRDSSQDEFLEFVNTSGASLDVSGYMIYDFDIETSTRTLRHTIPANTTVPNNGFLVIFGGETTEGAVDTSDFDGAVVIVDTGSAGLSLNNSGEMIIVENAAGTEIITFDSDALSNNPDESYTRNPDITGEFEQHAGVTEANGAVFSPGTNLDGTQGATASIDSQIKPQFTFFPNPLTNGVLTFENIAPGPKNIRLFDMNGRSVFNQETDRPTIALPGVTTGIYLLQLTTQNGTQTSRLIVK